MSLVKCLNCGAEIDSDLVKCPYCGYLNETGARKAHEETLEKIEDEIESNIAMGDAAYSQGVKKTGKSSAVGIGLVLVIFGLIALAFFLFWRFGDKTNVVVTPEKTVSEIAFIEDAFPRWDEMYYDEKFDELAKEFEEYSENHNLFVYENYEFLYAYSLYDRMKSEAVPALDAGSADKVQKEALTYYACYFYYRAYEASNPLKETVSGKTGMMILDEIRDNYILPIISERLCLSEDELEEIREDVTDGDGRLVRSDLYRKMKKYYDRYR